MTTDQLEALRVLLEHGRELTKKMDSCKNSIEVIERQSKDYSESHININHNFIPMSLDSRMLVKLLEIYQEELARLEAEFQNLNIDLPR